MVRQSGNIFDIPTDTCSRSSCTFGCVNQQRVHSLILMAFVGRPTRAKLVSSLAPRASLATACARLPGFTRLKKILDASWGATRSSIAYGIRIDALPCSTPCALSGPAGTGECISPTSIFNDLLFKNAVLSDRLCILMAGLSDAFVTAFNLRRTHRGLGLNIKELMQGRIKMMTALCPALDHTMCLGFHLDQLRP